MIAPDHHKTHLRHSPSRKKCVSLLIRKSIYIHKERTFVNKSGSRSKHRVSFAHKQAEKRCHDATPRIELDKEMQPVVFPDQCNCPYFLFHSLVFSLVPGAKRTQSTRKVKTATSIRSFRRSSPTKYEDKQTKKQKEEEKTRTRTFTATSLPQNCLQARKPR